MSNKPKETLAYIQARRTAFVARFIVLRESKRCKSHRQIERMRWEEDSTAEELAEQFKGVFKENSDNLDSVERDLDRALAHASRSIEHFVEHYVKRSGTSFLAALEDYEASNKILFLEESERPKSKGWQNPESIRSDLSNSP